VKNSFIKGKKTQNGNLGIGELGYEEHFTYSVAMKHSNMNFTENRGEISSANSAFYDAPPLGGSHERGSLFRQDLAAQLRM